MNNRTFIICLIAIGLIAASAARLVAFYRAGDPDLDRRPSTVRQLSCADCEARRAVSQAEIYGMYRPDGPRSPEGEPLFACGECGRTNARLIVRSTREK